MNGFDILSEDEIEQEYILNTNVNENNYQEEYNKGLFIKKDISQNPWELYCYETHYTLKNGQPVFDIDADTLSYIRPNDFYDFKNPYTKHLMPNLPMDLVDTATEDNPFKYEETEYSDPEWSNYPNGERDENKYFYEIFKAEMPSPIATKYYYKICAYNATTGLFTGLTNSGNNKGEIFIEFMAKANSVADLVDGAITQNKLTKDCVTSDNIAAGTITADKLVADDLLAKGAYVGMLRSEGIKVDDAGFWASKPFTYDFIKDPSTGIPENYQTEAGEFFVGNNPNHERGEDDTDDEYIHYVPSESKFYLKIKNFVVKSISSIINGQFIVKRTKYTENGVVIDGSNETDDTAFFCVNPQSKDKGNKTSAVLTPQHSLRVGYNENCSAATHNANVLLYGHLGINEEADNLQSNSSYKLYVHKSDSKFDGDVVISSYTSGSTTSGGNLSVSSNQIINGKLRIALGATQANCSSQTQTLYIGGTSYLGGNTNISGTLNVSSSTSLKGTLTVGTLTSNASTTLNGSLSVSGATTLSSTLSVSGATTLSSTLSVSGATTLSSTLTVSSSTTLNGATSINNTLTVGTTSTNKKTTLHGKLDVDDDAALFGNLTVGTSTANKSLTVNGTMSVTGESSLAKVICSEVSCSNGSGSFKSVSAPTIIATTHMKIPVGGSSHENGDIWIG